MHVVCEEFGGTIFIDICLDQREIGFVKDGLMACGSTYFGAQKISIGVLHDINKIEEQSDDYATEEGEE